MAIEVRKRRGTSAQINNFKPARGEIIYNTDDGTLHVGNGYTKGGNKFSNLENDHKYNVALHANADKRFGVSAKKTRESLTESIHKLADVGGGTLFIPSGEWIIDRELPVFSNISFVGNGPSSVLKKAIGESDTLFENVDRTDKIGVSFSRMTLAGRWQEDPNQTRSGSLVRMKFAEISMNDCIIRDCRYFALNFNECIDADIHRCNFIRIARDACAIWNTPNVRVVNNYFAHNDDDCISLNSAGFEPIGAGKTTHIVTDNILIDTGGIKIQNAKNTIISDNVLSRTKGNGAIYVTAKNSKELYRTNPQSVSINDNIILDTIDRNISNNGSLTVNSRVAIKLETIGGRKGNGSAIPGYPDPETGIPVAPYSNYYTTDTGNTPVRIASGVSINGNLIKRTLPAVKKYSDWGFGKMFSRMGKHSDDKGMIDPSISDTALEQRPIEIRGPLRSSMIKNNIIAGGGISSIYFYPTGQKTHDYDGLVIEDNDIDDSVGKAIDMKALAGTYQRILIKGNSFNCDPFFRSNARKKTDGVVNGAWRTRDSCVAIYGSNVSGHTIEGNNFRNCSIPFIQGGTADRTVKRDNILYCQPVSIGFNQENKGIGNITTNDFNYELQVRFEDSDPTSETYGEQLEGGLNYSNRMPTKGYYVEGFVLTVNDPNIFTMDGEKSRVSSWLRLTTGNSHVSEVDWVANVNNIR